MAELDTIVLSNPTEEEFVQNFNGEPYVLAAGETKAFAKFVGFHIAKHLSDKMVKDAIPAKVKKEKPLYLAQLMIYDNPQRRIALYKIFQDVNLVMEVIAKYPFKGFMGDMSEYETFVNREEQRKNKEETPQEAEKPQKAETKKARESKSKS